MSVKPIYRASGAALRNALRGNVALTPAFGPIARTSPVALQFKEARYGVRHNYFGRTQNFHSSSALAGLMPESSDPPPKESEPSENPTAPTYVSTSEYNKLADACIEELRDRLEQEQEKREDIDVEFSVSSPFLSKSLVNMTNSVIPRPASWKCPHPKAPMHSTNKLQTSRSGLAPPCQVRCASIGLLPASHSTRRKEVAKESGSISEKTYRCRMWYARNWEWNWASTLMRHNDGIMTLCILYSILYYLHPTTKVV